MTDALMDPFQAALAGHYRVERELGSGGMATVYLAQDLRHNRQVAIKVLKPELAVALGKERFLREIEIAAQLVHPHILPLHDSGEAAGCLYYVMPRVEGESLRQRLEREPRLTIEEAISITSAVAGALDSAHRHGVIHRDIKPENILLQDGEPMIGDFGIAMAVNAAGVGRLTETGLSLGTPLYMSPEQASGGRDLDGRSDIYSLGCVLYEMLTGRPPSEGTTLGEVLAAKVLGRLTPVQELRPDLPDRLRRALEKALAPTPERRFATASAFASAIGGVIPDLADRRPRVRRRLAVIAAGVVTATAVTLIVLGSIVALRGRHLGDLLAAQRTVAVIPFENASKDPELDFLSDGITEGLIGALAKLPNTRVAARTSVFTYKNKPIDLDQVRRDLGVRTVLTGKVIGRGSDVTVQVDLIDVRTKAELWGERYQRDLRNPLGLEQAIVARVAERLRINLTREQRSTLAARPTENAEAYRLYLKGRYAFSKVNREGYSTARQYYQQAIDLDPTFALAFVGLADIYTLLSGRERAVPQEEALARAAAAANRALEIDPSLGQAHASLGNVEANRFRFKAAERELRTAIDLNPNYSEVRNWYAHLLRALGRLDEALAQHRKAIETDPLDAALLVNHGATLLITGDIPGAMAAANKALELDPAILYAHWVLGMAHEKARRYPRAADEYRRMSLLPGPPHMARAALARVQARMADTAAARRTARELESLPTGEVSPTYIAWIYAGLGDNTRALSWLEKAVEDHDAVLRDSVDGVPFAELREDLRYTDLVRRMRSM